MQERKEMKIHVSESLRDLAGYANSEGIGRGDVVTVLYRGGDYILVYYGECGDE